MSALSPLITAESGVLGSTIYSHNQYGPYTRPRVVPVHPLTIPQRAARIRMTFVSTAWDALSLADKQAWQRYADGVTVTDRIGQEIHLTGRQEFFRTNFPRRRCGAAIATGPPLSLRRVQFTPPQFVLSPGAPPQTTIWIGFWTTDEWHAPGGYICWKLTRPVSRSINFFNGSFRYATRVTYSPGAPPFFVQSFTIFDVFDYPNEHLFTTFQATTPDGRMTYQAQTVIVPP